MDVGRVEGCFFWLFYHGGKQNVCVDVKRSFASTFSISLGGRCSLVL